MISWSPEMKEEVRSRLDQLESEYRRREPHGSLFDYPVLLLSFVVPSTLLVAFVALILIPRFGGGVGTLIGLLCFVLFAVAFNGICDRLSHRFLRSGDKASLKRAFNEAFPLENEEEREMALDILDQAFEEFLIAKIVLGSPTGLDVEAFEHLVTTTGEGSTQEGEFVFQCDPSLLERNTIKALTHYGNRLQALATGESKPQTPAQERFVRIHRREEDPSTQPEGIWQSYQDAVRWQSFIDTMNEPTLSEYLRSYPYADEKYHYMHRKLKGSELDSAPQEESESGFSEEQT